ncbi:MAG: hypothetical protein R2705_22655 [Ilumatobacteraceae bacterium]
MVADPEGGWVLYTIGEPVPAEEQVHECENGAHAGETPWGCSPNCVVNVQHADELEGPRTERQVVMDASWNQLCPTNPAPVIHDDGSVSLVYRAYDFASWRWTATTSSSTPPRPTAGTASIGWSATGRSWTCPPRTRRSGNRTTASTSFNQKFTEPERIGGAAHGPSLTDLEPADPFYSPSFATTTAPRSTSFAGSALR